jgi:hypothetical protein
VADFRGIKPGINLGDQKYINAATRDSNKRVGAGENAARESLVKWALQPNADNLTLFRKPILYLRSSKQKMNSFV